jgi:hypothetical protein
MKWQVKLDDPRAEAIIMRFERVWLRLTNMERVWLLCAAESMATAEKAKAEWNPKGQADLHSKLRQVGVQAAKLAIEIRSLSRGDSDTRVVRELAKFAEETVLSTLPITKRRTAQLAGLLVRGAVTRLKRRTGYKHLEFIANLAWLAGGLQTPDPISEKSVRRLLQNISSSMGYKKRAARKASSR